MSITKYKGYDIHVSPCKFQWGIDCVIRKNGLFILSFVRGGRSKTVKMVLTEGKHMVERILAPDDGKYSG